MGKTSNECYSEKENKKKVRWFFTLEREMSETKSKYDVKRGLDVWVKADAADVCVSGSQRETAALYICVCSDS